MLGIVIINFNTYKITIDCINSIFSTYKNPFKIYLIDNNSADESVSVLENEYKNNDLVNFIKNSKNIGYARANNIGIEMAAADGCEKILISNNDIIFHENAIYQMEKSLEQTNALIVAPKIFKLDGSIQSSIKPKKLSFTQYWLSNSYFYNLMTKKQKEAYFSIPKDITEVYMVSGACFIADTKKFNEIGFFDPYTFLYCEEFIISEKAIKKGYKIYIDPKSVVTHYHGASTDKSIQLFAKSENLKSELYVAKNYFDYSNTKIRFLVSLRRLEVLYSCSKTKEFSKIKSFIKDSKKIYIDSKGIKNENKN